MVAKGELKGSEAFLASALFINCLRAAEPISPALPVTSTFRILLDFISWSQYRILLTALIKQVAHPLTGTGQIAGLLVLLYRGLWNRSYSDLLDCWFVIWAAVFLGQTSHLPSLPFPHIARSLPQHLASHNHSLPLLIRALTGSSRI